MRPGETLSLTMTLPNEQQIQISEAVVRWSRGQEFAVESLAIALHTYARLHQYVKRLVREPEEMIPCRCSRGSFIVLFRGSERGGEFCIRSAFGHTEPGLRIVC